jgi:pyrimidine deaminase RibD-like protein
VTTPSDADRQWLLEAIELSRQCPPTDTAYCVGAIIVAADGTELADGYSRETDPHVHAEEAALAKINNQGRVLEAATIYTSMEPCSIRKSRPQTCTQLILDAGIGRVIFALREPPLFADCQGATLLSACGVEIIEINDLGPLVLAVNSTLLPPQQ